MSPNLRAFVRQYLMVVFATFMPVAVTSFVSFPMNLGGSPGEAHDVRLTANRHMT